MERILGVCQQILLIGNGARAKWKRLKLVCFGGFNGWWLVYIPVRVFWSRGGRRFINRLVLFLSQKAGRYFAKLLPRGEMLLREMLFVDSITAPAAGWDVSSTRAQPILWRCMLYINYYASGISCLNTRKIFLFFLQNKTTQKNNLTTLVAAASMRSTTTKQRRKKPLYYFLNTCLHNCNRIRLVLK